MSAKCARRIDFQFYPRSTVFRPLAVLLELRQLSILSKINNFVIIVIGNVIAAFNSIQDQLNSV